jgi:uncharacterized protein (TIGR00369 family)
MTSTQPDPAAAPHEPDPATAPHVPGPEWGQPRTKTITWYDIDTLRRNIATLPGREFLQAMIDGRLPPPPIAQMSASRLVEIGDGVAVFRCRPDESFLNPLGLVHGGLLCTLLDSAMGVAVQTTQPAGIGYASVELKVSFLKPLPYGEGAEFEARGEALQVGRRIAFAEGHAYDAAGELVGHATSSLVAVGRA